MACLYADVWLSISTHTPLSDWLLLKQTTRFIHSAIGNIVQTNKERLILHNFHIVYKNGFLDDQYLRLVVNGTELVQFFFTILNDRKTSLTSLLISSSATEAKAKTRKEIVRRIPSYVELEFPMQPLPQCYISNIGCIVQWARKHRGRTRESIVNGLNESLNQNNVVRFKYGQ